MFKTETKKYETWVKSVSNSTWIRLSDIKSLKVEETLNWSSPLWEVIAEMRDGKRIALAAHASKKLAEADMDGILKSDQDTP